MTSSTGDEAPTGGNTPRKVRPPQINGGFLNVDKPAGMTSMDVIRIIRRLTGQKRVGHGGTLDPDATGVLPICIGRASRFIERFVQGRKVYEATATFGSSTDTYDASGRVTAESDASGITLEAIETALPQFIGEIQQVPPMYSAIKVNGERLYKLAREGKEIEREARDVVVHGIKLISWNSPTLKLRIECGGGFYVRSLIHDMGLTLDNAAHMVSLVRSQVGRFTLDSAVTLEQLEEATEAGGWEQLLYPIDTALMDVPAVVVDPAQEEAIGYGKPVQINTDVENVHQEVRAYNREGELIALMSFDPVLSRLTPIRVLAAR
ncbi:MAG: tRNA pseudouridine(55) synthase TruB [Chloroflexi bacterium]|nr:tRNA pseudouridine(55) synthase TruB [Chloroflexota bacterium]MBT4072321.1 tRNA pseudouridine(55) synthase TruB [Chloroflexota bacterium]MBT4515583.1 tRNA pseudouridine(55) synthase TruB [Chloroflexota bacterium]MBT5318857.1 tRNA pseudouridine(55) synthase TruB [Chloroflexota bacterium]MBT6680865.1 tRNA pseudouridine(55) synthase TruB [Chloroflexota bacterium]